MGALEPLLGKLSDILGNEFIKLKDNCCEISFLLDELSTMKIALEKMSEQEEADPLGRQWMSQLQELAYDAEDVIDTFILHPSNISTSSGMIKKVLNKFTNLKAEYQFAGQIKQLKERTLEVSDRRKRYKMDHVASPKYIPLDPRLPALFEEPGSLVGIESQINDIVKWITDANSLYSQSSVLSIVGFGGLGKTTLANLVFKKVSGDFECTAFVAASRSPDILIILRHILLQVCQGDNLSTTDQFAKMLIMSLMRCCIFAKCRFLIVIDDIWSRQAWQQIRCVFPQNTKGSRIITTTRIKDVATYCSPRKTDLVHHITPLDADNSRKLFLKRVCHRDEDCPADLKTTVDNILRKCQGLPLAIVNIGSLLANKTRSKDVWENVLTSLGAALEQDHELQMVQKILCLSYHDLPSHLKVCFLDLSTFPEDYKIEVERLKKRWIAEGFVSERKGQCMEDTAESYIIELVNTNMMQPMDIEYDGKPAACQLHDIMLDLALVLSLKENFSTVMGGHKMAPSNKMRRLSLQGDIEGHALWQGRDLSHI
ncbi:hypothetical protein PR202_gb03269 [Eleusine coracana subsp. coracana]|uniref:Uncharacterized protein n=1 Tax=Eleusine coracana subsp. coracana TaxID=191504 RepID=A0AAV5E1D2_ELECO|nr:hypothetical protein PR202_gb03269 [Eleusine coracana subsp. coracana]